MRRLRKELRAALADFDAEDAASKDRHPDGCCCALCAFVAAVRGAVEEKR